jgi:hypothetical protein
MVVEVNWEGCHHRDLMVVAEKVSEQVLPMTVPEMMAAPAPGGLSEIHHSRGL